MLRPLSLAVALLLSLPALAATKTAPLEVSLTVKESCRIEYDASTAAAPAVTCALDSPYRLRDGATVQRHAVDPAPKAIQHPLPAQWEVVF